jgi:hypothetical protein
MFNPKEWFNSLRIRRLKREARNLCLEGEKILLSYGCGHSVGMQLQSYNSVHTRYIEVLSELKYIDPNFPKPFK